MRGLWAGASGDVESGQVARLRFGRCGAVPHSARAACGLRLVTVGAVVLLSGHGGGWFGLGGALSLGGRISLP